VDFLDFITAPQLNERSQQSASYASYTAGFAMHSRLTTYIKLCQQLTVLKNDGDQFLLGNSLVNVFTP